MNDKLKANIKQAANNTRKRVLGLTIERKGGYLSQACSSSDVLSTLYMGIMNLTESEAPFSPPDFPGVPSPTHMDYVTGAAYNGSTKAPYDRFIFSPAHYAVVVYSTLMETGRLDPASIESFNVDGSSMEMIGAEHSPGFECTTGSLGQALSIGAGVALARKMRGEEGRIFVYLSDGEIQEGQNWEALQFASHNKLDNLVIVVDVNGQQLDGLTKDVMNIEPLASRMEAFGAHAEKIDGHDIDAIYAASMVKHEGKPLAMLTYTNPAQGVPLLEERKPFLHYVRFKSDEEEKQYQDFYDSMK